VTIKGIGDPRGLVGTWGEGGGGGGEGVVLWAKCCTETQSSIGLAEIEHAPHINSF